jgi:WD40 repeat protein
MLDSELSALPEKWRQPMVLCYLEGRTQDETARQLKCSKNTVRRRLEEARNILAKRLRRRGAVWSTALVGVLLTDCVTLAVPPASLLRSTIQELASFAVKNQLSATVSGKVAMLTKGVLKTMLLTKLKIATTVMLVLIAVLSWTSGLLPNLISADEPPPLPKSAAHSTARGDKVENELKPMLVLDNAIAERLVYIWDGGTIVSLSTAHDHVKVKHGAGLVEREVVLANSTVKVWDTKTGKLTRTPVDEKMSDFNVTALSSNGKAVAFAVTKIEHEAGMGPAPVEIWIMDPENWQLKLKLTKELKLIRGEWIQTLSVSPDGKTLVFGGYSPLVEDGSFIQIMDVEKKSIIAGTKKVEVKSDDPKSVPEELEEKPNRVTCLAHSPDGKAIAVGDAKGRIRFYSAKTGEEKQVLCEEGKAIRDIAFSPDGKMVATIRVPNKAGATVSLWDFENGKLLRNIKASEWNVTTVAFTPNGKLLATAGLKVGDKVEGEVKLWDVGTGKMKHTVDNLIMPVSALAFSPDGKVLAIGGGDPGKSSGQIDLVPLESLTTIQK